MMKVNLKYSVCIQGTRDDWFFNGIFKGSSGRDGFFVFYDEKDDWNYEISWNKVIWYKER